MSDAAVGFSVLRVRNLRNETSKVTYYSSVWLERSGAIETLLRRLESIGALKEEVSPSKSFFTLDLIDDAGDIIDDRLLSDKGFKYLYRKYHMRVIDTEVLGE